MKCNSGGMKNLSALVALLLLPLAAFAQGVTALPPMSVITFAAGKKQRR